MRVVLCAWLTATLAACGQPYVNIPFKPDPALWTPECDDLTVDWADATCQNPQWQAPACAQPVLVDAPEAGHDVVALPTALTYTASPPLSGSHRPDWARWGEYAYLPPQVWLHNLEVGGIVVLYHPCVPASVVDDLRQWLRVQPADAAGLFRWILTPYPGLTTPFAILAWQHSLAGTCLDATTADAFAQAHYRHAPEDTTLMGAYQYGWLGGSGALYVAPTSPPPTCTDAATTDGM